MRWRTGVQRLTLQDITAKASVEVWSETDRARFESWRPVFDQLSIPPGDLLDRFCPVQREDLTCQLLVLAECADDNDVTALLLVMRQAGLVMCQPNVLLVPAVVLGELNRRLRLAEQPSLDVVTLQTPKHVLFSLLDDVLLWAIQAGASDIHLTLHSRRPNADIAFTVDGWLVRPTQFQAVEAQMLNELLSIAWMGVRGGNGAVFDPGREQQGRLERCVKGREIGLRWASLVTGQGPSVCLRVLNPKGRERVPPLAELGYTRDQLAMLERACSGDGGAVIFAGMVGSGKSTTLASLVQEIPQTRKIITLEDPVEYVLDNALQCLVVSLQEQTQQPEQTNDSDLAIKLKTIKRSAAHDVLIGEIRDRLGGQALTDLVLSGTSVYTTLHASSVMQVLLRLSSSMIGVPESLLAMPGILKLLVYQALLPKLCAVCALPFEKWLNHAPLHCSLNRVRTIEWAEQWWQSWLTATGVAPELVRFRHPAGCTTCRRDATATHHGYHGRFMVTEMIEPSANPGFYDAIGRLGLAQQISAWQTQLLNRGRCDLQHFRPIRSQAIDYLQTGWLDPRDYERRFGMMR
uniref:ATPase, T2SS/T4P/T4SS family n=1 Tax=Orrella sp. TaxID=1921583 RepID=UPI004048D4BD